MQLDYWEMSPEEALAASDSSKEGLSDIEARKRLGQYGPNDVTTGKRLSGLRLFISQFRSPLVYVLVVATVIAAIAGELTDALIIIGIVLANSTLGFLLEYRSGRALEKLRKYVQYHAKVIRDGAKVMVDSKQVVPGDIIELSVGDVVPADLRLIESENLSMNESMLTGESLPVEKNIRSIKAKPIPQDLTNAVFMGTNVLSGTAKGVAVSTGGQTYLGRSAQYLLEEFPETEFSKSVKRFGGFLVEVVAVMTTFVFVANVLLQRPIVESMLFALALAVGITPEAMPFVITISLSRGSLRMAKNKVVVKRLEAIEDIGNMDVLCTDKTGTLTENVVTVESYFTPENQPSERVIEMAAAACDISINNGKVVGMPIDSAVCNHIVKRFGADILSAYQKLQVVPFDFSRRRMSVIAEREGKYFLICKGAPEYVIPACKDVQIAGVTEPIAELKDNLTEVYTTWSKSGYRIIAVATRDLPEHEIDTGKRFGVEDERDLTLTGFVTLLDPPRQDAIQALALFRKLRVDLKILSGDEPNVTAEICRSVGLTIKGGHVVTGSDIEGEDEEHLKVLAEEHNVFARVTPEQKVDIVKALKEGGHVVGFLGDGINDAPALRVADAGISVDNAVDVAKDAADIIILKKSLRVISDGIVEGRKTFGNTIKYILNTISANFGNMLTVAFSSIFLPFIPLLPTQVLLLNLLSDAPLIAISADNVDVEYLRSPKRWNIRFISEAMVFFGLISTLFDLMTMQVLHALLSFSAQGELLFRTGWFLESAFSEMFVTFSIRTHKPFYKSKPSSIIIATTGITVLATLIIIFTPLGSIFELVPLSLSLLMVVITVLLSYFVLLELLKRSFFKRQGFMGPSLQASQEIKSLRGKIRATRRKIQRLQTMRGSGEITEDTYLQLISELEEELNQLKEKSTELRQH